MPVLLLKSKNSMIFLPILAAAVLLFSAVVSNGQAIVATIRVDASLPDRAIISGRYANGHKSKNFWFIDEYARVRDLGDRVSNVELRDEKDLKIPSRKMMAGEFLAERNFTAWTYSISAAPRQVKAGAVHISRLDSDGGIIMLDDMLPQQHDGRSAKITFDLPDGWRITTAERETARNVYDVTDVSKAVFYVGAARRQINVPIAESLTFSLPGKWQFTDAQASKAAKSIFREYAKIFGSQPKGDFIIGIDKYKNPVPAGEWEADTRGRSVTIMSSDMPFASQSVQRLHEQLRHELFHLWIPNGVNLTGNYDWFYEGFALYQSLKTGVASNRISFSDMLDTLSRAKMIDAGQPMKVSLVETSKNRWNGGNTAVYARGMLVAFICDLALLEKSKGKRSVANLLREIYDKHRPPNQEQNATDAVLALMRSRSELQPIINRYITRSAIMDWAPYLNHAGIEARTNSGTTQLTVTANPTGRQKDLLDKLGYNSWRKLISNR